MSLSILPECFADTLLIKIIKYDRPHHCPSIGAVSNTMQKFYKNRLAIGVVDKDKPGDIPNYFNDFVLLIADNGLELKWHPDTKHYLVVVDPVLEKWLMGVADDLEIPTKKYGFKDIKGLKRLTKSEKAGQNQNLKQFFNTIKQKKGSPLVIMETWIDTVIDNKGKIEEIKANLMLRD